MLTAIAYSLFVASNIGLEFLGFILLFVSAISIGMGLFRWPSRHSATAIFLCCRRTDRDGVLVSENALMRGVLGRD